MSSEEWTLETVVLSAQPIAPAPVPSLKENAPSMLKFLMVAFFTKPNRPEPLAVISIFLMVVFSARGSTSWYKPKLEILYP